MANLKIYDVDDGSCLGPREVLNSGNCWLETHQEGEFTSNRTLLKDILGWNYIREITGEGTLEVADAGGTIVFNSTTNVNLTFPDNANVPLPLSRRTDVINIGAGNVTMLPLNPDVVLLVNGTFTLGQNCAMTLYQILQVNTFWIGGGLS